MDFQKIWLLLDVVHKSMNVPGTENIRKMALDEIASFNENAGAKEEPIEEPEEFTNLDNGRRL